MWRHTHSSLEKLAFKSMKMACWKDLKQDNVYILFGISRYSGWNFKNQAGISWQNSHKSGDTSLEKLASIKGIVHQFFFYRSNLIFWIVLGCGIADFGRRGL